MAAVGVCVLALGLLAADAEIHHDDRRGTLRFVTGRDLSAPLEADAAFRALQVPGREVDVARAFLDANRDAFGLARPRDELHAAGVTTDALGFHRVAFRQYVGAFPVHAAEVVVQLDADRHVTAVTGSYVRTPAAPPATATIRPAEAVRRARAAAGAGAAPPPATAPVLEWWPDDDGRVRLAYRVHVERTLADACDVWIDARRGGVLARIPTSITSGSSNGGLVLP